MTTNAVLPERTRLFHIGPPKTGTTALQEAAARTRPDLLAHGVRYPGTGTNHGVAVAAFLEQRWGWQGKGGTIPPMSRWFDLLAEIRSDRSNRVLFGHEYAAKADASTIARFAEAIGDLHVVVTLRPFAAMLPSTWQESLKLGATQPFEPWLRRVLQKPGPSGVDNPARNQGALVSRWASVIGADRVTVVALDRGRPELLFAAFEELLDLPSGLLAAGAATESGNRGLTRAEAEYLLRLNRAVRDDGLRWQDYAEYVAGAAIGRVVRERSPSSSEERLALPTWAAERANVLAADFVDTIRASGVRVLGELDSLADPVVGSDPGEAPRMIPVEVAVTSVRSAIATATRREPDPSAIGVDGREWLVVRHVGIGGLLLVVAGRVRRRAAKAVRLGPAALSGMVRRRNGPLVPRRRPPAVASGTATVR